MILAELSPSNIHDTTNHETLIQCALVASSWTPCSQKQLFKYITIRISEGNRRRSSALQALLKRAPHIASFVREVGLFLEIKNKPFDALRDILGALDRVDAFHLWGWPTEEGARPMCYQTTLAIRSFLGRCPLTMVNLSGVAILDIPWFLSPIRGPIALHLGAADFASHFDREDVREEQRIQKRLGTDPEHKLRMSSLTVGRTSEFRNFVGGDTPIDFSALRSIVVDVPKHGSAYGMSYDPDSEEEGEACKSILCAMLPVIAAATNLVYLTMSLRGLAGKHFRTHSHLRILLTLLDPFL